VGAAVEAVSAAQRRVAGVEKKGKREKAKGRRGNHW
jgi:hypothetical protein